MSQKYVYLFEEGNANMRELLGGKGRYIQHWQRSTYKTQKKEQKYLIKRMELITTK